jgi:NAD(P)-dependent dehydrogenase (short-subunit alcohol dehydrogenase family)
MKLENKVCVITGSSSGIGEAIARKFAESGAKVMLAARREANLNRLSEKIRRTGGKCKYMPTDITDESQVKNLFKKTLEEYGRVDVLVNSAGQESQAFSITETTEEEWDRIHNVDLKGPFLCCKEAFKIMERQKRGKIINIVSVAGKVGSSSRGIAYKSSKHGLMGLSKVLLREAKDKGISVTAINPGHVNTPMLRRYLEDEKVLKKAVSPEDVADVALFIATRDQNVIIPQITIYPRHEIDRYGMTV